MLVTDISYVHIQVAFVKYHLFNKKVVFNKYRFWVSLFLIVSSQTITYLYSIGVMLNQNAQLSDKYKPHARHY
jgi:hypothetical protein